MLVGVVRSALIKAGYRVFTTRLPPLLVVWGRGMGRTIVRRMVVVVVAAVVVVPGSGGGEGGGCREGRIGTGMVFSHQPTWRRCRCWNDLTPPSPHLGGWVTPRRVIPARRASQCGRSFWWLPPIIVLVASTTCYCLPSFIRSHVSVRRW